DLLKSVWKWQPPDKDKPEPASGSRQLGSLLKSLGFMSGDAGSGEYSLEIEKGLTVWRVVDGILNELDGFPLYVSGLKSKKDKDKRVAIALASQADLNDPTKKYFGLAGLAYNILLNPVAEKDSTAENGDKDETSIVLTKDNFTDDESIFVDEEE